MAEQENKTQTIAMLEVLKTAHWYEKAIIEVLKPFDISKEQYNVLRILENNPDRVFSLKEIQARLLNQTSNTTRLVNKLADKKYIRVVTSKYDKRKYAITLTAGGIKILSQIMNPLEQLDQKMKQRINQYMAERVTTDMREIRRTKL